MTMVATMPMSLAGSAGPELYASQGDKQQFRLWLGNLWTMGNLQQLFRKSELTLSQWIERDGMPVVRLKGTARDTLRFDREEVLAWAKAKGKRLYLQE